MDCISLNGTYKLKYFDHDSFHIEEVMRDDFFPDGWLDTSVPEDVRTVLRRQGYLDGYYYGKNLDKERWIDEKDWVYYRSFTVDERWRGRACALCLEGVDTVARVWLNGQLLGTCRNMFREYTFATDGILRIGEENRLVIHVLSPLGYTAHASREGIYPKDDTTRMLLRKSQMNWGWDFCGHCLTVGLWKPIRLESRDAPTLSDTFLTTESLDESNARLRLNCTVCRGGGQGEEIEIEMHAGDTTAFAHRMSAKEARSFSFVLNSPHPWWPRPYGEPFLYDVCIKLLHNGMTVDQKDFRFGLRTIELLQPPEDGGRGFVFCVNGRRLFIRGANWVPLNCVYAEIRPKDYDSAFARVLDSNLSMLRVWGGGIYESRHFLDLCDEHGIMVFQDIMLACGIFPQDEDFLQQVYEETSEIVRQNYNRACIVLWSADNELDEAYRWYDKLDEFPTNRVNRQAVRQAVLDHDPFRPFLVSSPCSPFPDEPGADDPNSDLQGDMHLYWTHFRKDEYYYKKILDIQPRFMSEYGFSSLPSEPSFSRFNFRRCALDLTRDPRLAHLDWLARLNDAGDTAQLIYYTQFTHAQALKYWIEYLRTLKWHCGGSLYWKFNDPIAPNRENMLFPSLMSVLDFYGLPKMAYYYARRAYEDRALCFREEAGGGLSVYGCSETTDDLPGKLELRRLAVAMRL